MTTKYYIPKIWSAVKAIRKKKTWFYTRKCEWLKIKELSTALTSLGKLLQLAPKENRRK